MDVLLSGTQQVNKDSKDLSDVVGISVASQEIGEVLFDGQESCYSCGMAKTLQCTAWHIWINIQQIEVCNIIYRKVKYKPIKYTLFLSTGKPHVVEFHFPSKNLPYLGVPP